MSDSLDISILIVEDEVVVAMDIARRIKKLGYHVLAMKHNGEEAIHFLEIQTPDLILCDINIGGCIDGIEVATFNQKNKKVPLIFITALSDRATLDRAKKSLPYGYIVKPFNNRDLLTAIELAIYKHRQNFEKHNLSNDRLSELLSEELSERELQLLEDIVDGLTNHEISKKRFISVSTVKFHIGNIFQKMEAKNRADILHKILKIQQ